MPKPSRKIIAIGGGEMGRPHENGGFYPVETTAIDQEILIQTAKKNPNLLFLGTASSNAKGYFDVVNKHFSKLGAKVSNLDLSDKTLNSKSIRQTILSADAIYVGGGNTLKMMTIWRRMGVDKMLLEAHRKGIVLAGLSAGSICWFSYGSSDSRRYSSQSTKLIKVQGLGLIQALHCPHYNIETHRQKDLKRMMKSTYKLVAIALDDCAALEVIDDQYRIIRSNKTAKAYKTYWKKGEYIQEEIPVSKEFKDLNSLVSK